MAQQRRIIFYSHDAQGLGHVRRNIALAHHIVSDNPGISFSGILLSALPSAAQFDLPEGFDWVMLPGVMKSDGRYQPRHLNESMAELLDLRSNLIETAFLSVKPDLVIIDRHAFGINGELRQPLHELRSRHPETKIVLGLREVLDSPEVAAREWDRLGDIDEFNALFDEIWLYGDSHVHDPLVTGEIPRALAHKVRQTGYLSQGRPDAGTTIANSPYVLTTAGGGSDGAALFQAAVNMRIPSGYKHIIVTGPQVEEDVLEQLRREARPNTTVLKHVSGLGGAIKKASAVISMGGYNTVNEILDSTTPALIVPRENPRKEQLIRARALAAHGAIDYLRVAQLSPAALSSWLHTAVTREVDRSGIERGGLYVAGRLSAQLLNTNNFKKVRV